MDPKLPYNLLPLLPPDTNLAKRSPMEKVLEATREIAELKGIAKVIPNQSIVLHILGMQEAKLSSEIENIVTTNDELFRAYDDQNLKIDSNTKEVLRYKEALWYGYNWVKSGKIINTPLFEDLVALLTQNRSGIRKLPGTSLTNTFHQVIYTPPQGEEVIREKLFNLERYIYLDDKVDPLIKMAIIHYQFEAIHPFYDGNGRCGRIINLLFLIEKEILNLPILYLSRYIIDNKQDYYLKLRAVTEKNDWEGWILFVLEGLIETAKITKKKIFAMQSAILQAENLIKKKLPKIYSKELIHQIFYHPYCKIKFFEEAGVAKRQTASIYLQKLEEIGLLRCVKKGREKYYINLAFQRILDNFS